MKRLDSSGAATYVSTAQVAEALGVSVTTVKRWVDDDILPAHRTAGGHRKMLLTDVVRLAREGHLPQADLTRLDRKFFSRVQDDPSQLVERLTKTLREGDATAVRTVIHGGYHGGLSVEALADAVIAPALAQIGHEWESGAIDVLHEHRGTQLTAAAVFELKAVLERHAERDRPTALGAAIEGDHYMLPTLLAQMALLDAGWEAINLGPNTPFSSLSRAIVEFQPRLVWISVSYLNDACAFSLAYREFFQVAKERGIAVALGGRALPDEVRAHAPYTFYGDGLRHLVEFARTLHPRPRPPKRGRPLGT